MFYKGIIFDVDGTLYNYDVCHEYALKIVINYLSYNSIDVSNIYAKISNDLKKELIKTASSHNKSIYLKHVLEKLNCGLSDFSTIHILYWKSFYEKMECYPGVKEFILWNKQQKIQIGILTDYETEYQIIKLEKLGLLEHIDCIITSEEIGKEKPSVQMFHAILSKMNLGTEDVIMIGDNFQKDIIGANDLNIFAYWFSLNVCIIKSEKYISFNNFEILLRDFKLIYSDLIELKKISKYCGERFDLVQAGGGNTSVKTGNNWLVIKASGYNLSNIDTKNGYVVMNNAKILKDIDDGNIKDVLNYNAIGNKRGSIETFMHSILKKYTVHLHPIQVNRILVSKNAHNVINVIYPSALIIDYLTPGINVCNKIQELYNGQNVIFLLNHGIIVTSDEIDEVYHLINDVLTKFENFQNLHMNRYKFTNTISKNINLVFDVDNVSYLSEDKIINKYLCEKYSVFLENVTFPDALIYCGEKCLFGMEKINEYKELYRESPKMIIANDSLYINAASLSKCKEIEDVLKSQLVIIDSDFDKNYLSPDEICFLNNWDSEKYRKNIQ